jgi:hypothetical protein
MAALSKHRHALISFAALLIGIAMGTAYGWSSVSIVDTGPWQLHPDYQGFYVQAVADAYAAGGGDGVALQRLSFFCGADGVQYALDQAERIYGSDPVAASNLARLRALVDGGTWEQSAGDVCNTQPATPSYLGLINTFFPIAIVVFIIAFAAYIIFQMIRGGGEEETPTLAAAPTVAGAAAPPPSAAPTKQPPKRPPKGAPSIDTAVSPAARGAALSATAERTDYASEGRPPIVQFMTTYLHGDDLYDDTFSIETATGQFLGETGVAIAETVDEKEGKKVTAFEVWLFDKNDIRTVTKVLMSEYAFHDDAIKAKLAPKGEAVLAQAGDTITLETATLRVKARLVDLSYGSGPFPPNSFFERITIELAAWPREDARPAGGMPPMASP